jgi:DNA-binding response OmpR family regulator
VVRALIRLLDRRGQPLDFAERPRALVVDADRASAVPMASRLGSAGFLADVVTGPRDVRDRLATFRPSAMVVSARKGEKAVAVLVRAVRSTPEGRDLAIVVVDARSVAFRVWMLDHGADVCFPPGTAHSEVGGTLAALVRRRSRSGARTDRPA